MTVGFVALDEPGGGLAHVHLLRSKIGKASHLHAIDLRSARRVLPLSAVMALRRDRQLAKATVIHVHGIRAAFITWLSGITRRRPTVVTVHGLHAVRRSRGLARFGALRLTRAALGCAARVLFVGQSDMQLATDGGLVAQERAVRMSPLFQPQSPVRLQEGEDAVPRVVWAGRMEPEKDPLLFLEAVARVADSTEAEFIVAGDGSLRDDLTQHSIAASQQLRILPWQIDLWSSFGPGDIYVSTSRWEGLPMSACEAASAGLALVGTRVPGNEDLARDGVPIALVEATPEAVGAALLELLRDPAAVRRAGSDARDMVMAAYPASRAAEIVTACYLSALSEVEASTP